MIQSSKSDRRLGEQTETLAQVLKFVSEAPLAIAYRLAGVHLKIAEMTRSLFQSEVTIKFESDPEIDDEYFTVQATAHGEDKEIVELMERWHTLSGQTGGVLAGIYRLSLDVK